MEWRCTWCGKPHAENDPPCDNCGHNKFERAVEQINETTDSPSEPVWVCTECGRQHTKNSPPCKRCGNVHLEKRQPDWEDLDDLGGTSYWDVLEPKYVAGYLLAAILGLTLVLVATGVITLPGTGRPPVPDDVAGDGEQVGDLSLSAVESAYVEQLNERRSEAGVAPLSNDSDLEWWAAYVNKRTVQNVTGDGAALSREEFDRVTEYCPRQPAAARYTVFSIGGVENFENETVLAQRLVESWQSRQQALDESRTRIGVDVHVAPNERIFVTVAVC